MNPEEMVVKLTETEARSKSNTKRLDRLEKNTDAIHRLATAVEVMAKEQEHQSQATAELKGELSAAISEVRGDVSTLSDKVDAIEQKPAKRWDGLVEKAIYGVVGALVAAISAGIVYAIQVAA